MAAPEVHVRVRIATADALFYAAVSDVAGILGIESAPLEAEVLPSDVVIIDTATWSGTLAATGPALVIACVPGSDRFGAAHWSAIAAWTIRRERLAEELFDALRAAALALPSGDEPG